MRILIAEDDRSVREILDMFLVEAGHSVKAAVNGAELVRAALEERPDLVVTDLHMPEMSGDSMIAMLEMYPDLAGVPVIVISGATPGELADMGISPDIPVLGKPLDFGRISAELDRVEQRRNR